MLETIKQRLFASMLSPSLSEAAVQQAFEMAAALRPDGSWADIDGADHFARGEPEHLRRTLHLAHANRSRVGGALDDALRRALDRWLANDFQSADWSQNQLVVPRLTGSTALLMGDVLSPGAQGKVAEILARSRWQHWIEPDGWTEWTGTTLIQVARNVLLRGCICETPGLFEEAFGRVFRAVKVAADGEAGIQPDMIYRARPTPSSGGYEGLAYATECAGFVLLAHGTPWQASNESMKVLAAFLLDGQQWLMRNGVIDSGFMPEGVKRETVDLERLAGLIERIAQLGDVHRRAELGDLARRLLGQGTTLAGHRHFWNSAFSVHQRSEYYTSVCLPSGRVRPDGPLETMARAGMIRVMRSGGEYEGVKADGIANGLPGTTFLRTVVAPKPEEQPEDHVSMTGGVSEGDYGLAAMQVSRPGFSVTKAWFYLDDSFVCLGAGISATGSPQAVFTSVNECRLNGPVVAAADRAQARTLPSGGEHTLPMVRRVAHDGVTYYFMKPTRVIAQVGMTSGKSAAAIAGPERFTLLVNHGLHPRDESYGYIVLPLGEESTAKAKIDQEVAQIEVLANTPVLQAVRHKELRLLGAVFWQAGLMTLPDGGRVAANQPCVLLVRESATGKRLSIANVRQEPATVHVEYAGRCLCFELPGGLDAGRGASRSL